MVCSVQIVDVPNRIKRTTRRRLEDSSCDSAADGGAGGECVVADDSIVAVADADNSVI